MGILFAFHVCLIYKTTKAAGSTNFARTVCVGVNRLPRSIWYFRRTAFFRWPIRHVPGFRNRRGPCVRLYNSYPHESKEILQIIGLNSLSTFNKCTRLVAESDFGKFDAPDEKKVPKETVGYLGGALKYNGFPGLSVKFLAILPRILIGTKIILAIFGKTNPLDLN